MSDPINFDSTTPRFALPLLFAGQAQKEVFVNEALSLADALMHCAVQDEVAAPPATPAEGHCWLVANAPTGGWAGQANKIACRQAGQWLFVAPRDGMRIMNLTTGQDMRRLGGTWMAPTALPAPSGGAIIDSEARVAIVNLLQSLQDAGIFPGN